MDLIAAFERAIEGMEWEELVSILQAVLNDLLDNAPTPSSPAPSSLPLPPVPAGLELNTCPRPAISEGGGAVCHLMAAPTTSQGVYSQGQYLPYQWPLLNVPTAAAVSPSAVLPLTVRPQLTTHSMSMLQQSKLDRTNAVAPAVPVQNSTTKMYSNVPVVRVPDGFIRRPVGVLNGELLYVVTAETSAPPVPAAPPVNTSSSKKIKCESQQGEDRPYIKKPLNAFMLFAKEQRASITAEIMKRESTIVNTVLGQRWNSMTREEQAKYYDQAEKERLLHAQRHPGWSTSDNYGKKKRKKKTVRNSRRVEVFTCKREVETGGMEAPHTQTSVMGAPLVAQTAVMKPCALWSVKVQKPRSETPATAFVCGMCHPPQGHEFSPDSWLDAAPSTSQAALAVPAQTAPNQRTPEHRCHPVMQHLQPLCLTAQPQLPSMHKYLWIIKYKK